MSIQDEIERQFKFDTMRAYYAFYQRILSEIGELMTELVLARRIHAFVLEILRRDGPPVDDQDAEPYSQEYIDMCWNRMREEDKEPFLKEAREIIALFQLEEPAEEEERSAEDRGHPSTRPDRDIMGNLRKRKGI